MSNGLQHRKINKKRIVHVEVVIRNTHRNRKFYERLFGWNVDGDGNPGYVLAEGDVQQASAPRFGITKTPPHLFEDVAQNVIPFFEVPDIDRLLDNLPEGGAVFVEKENHPSGGHIAVIKAPDGNLFGVLER